MYTQHVEPRDSLSLIQEIAAYPFSSYSDSFSRAERLYLNRLSTMIKNSPSLLSQSDIHGNMPLHLAVSRNCYRIIGVLLEAGARVNQVNCCGYTPLYLAVLLYKSEAVVSLLKHDADPFFPVRDFLSKRVITPYELAKERCFQHAMRLFQYCVPPNVKSTLCRASANNQFSSLPTELVQHIKAQARQQIPDKDLNFFS